MPDRAAGAAASATVELSLHGTFAVRTLQGEDLTPKPQKARALLALLATAPDLRRARRWLEERLWSDRGPQQAAGSLRQALVDLRRALGPHGDIVNATRDWVEIRQGSLNLVTPVGEFLEGISVRDPAFLRWLDAQRRQHATMQRETMQPVDTAGSTSQSEAGSLRPVVMRVGTAGHAGTLSGLVAEILSARIAAEVSDHLTVSIISRGNGPPPPGCDIDVICSVVEDNGICLAFLKVIHLPSARVIFAKDCRFVGTASSLVGSEDLIRCAFEAAETTVKKIPVIVGLGRSSTRSAALGQLALHRMFTFDEAQLGEADRLMEQAWEVEENPVHLAWRGLLQMVKAIEVPRSLKPELHDLAQRLTAYALERDEGNPTVKALVAQTRAMLFGDSRTSGIAAARAVQENPRNPFALQALAVARMLAGDGEEAYRMSLLGRSYASQSSFRHWWDAHHATICIATGRYTEAISAAEAARFEAPKLRPAYRFLIALYAHRGDLEKANKVREELERLEPGFSLDRMAHDPDYPVRTLRNTGLVRNLRKLE
jgi:DNA-binding SARP family transcriptional activator